MSNCYYGITQDGDVNPEEDWKSRRCMTDEDEQCMGAYCLGPSAACFKARYGELGTYKFNIITIL